MRPGDGFPGCSSTWSPFHSIKGSHDLAGITLLSQSAVLPAAHTHVLSNTTSPVFLRPTHILRPPSCLTIPTGLRNYPSPTFRVSLLVSVTLCLLKSWITPESLGQISQRRPEPSKPAWSHRICVDKPGNGEGDVVSQKIWPQELLFLRDKIRGRTPAEMLSVRISGPSGRLRG